ncbi:hypothetical protein ACFGXH_02940 [Pasteurella multocida]|nr:hypothetical protein [Pasteurella multocida]
MAKKKPLGIRNNNPGNIEWGSPWQGLKAKTKNSGRFAEFESPVYGIRAIAVLLITYYDKRKSRDGSKIDTIKEVIERWAPPVENNSTAYAKAVSDLLGVTPTSKINMHDYATIRAIVCGIIRHENGRGPLDNDNTWYSEDVIDEGLRRAGVVKKNRTVSKIPVTKESVGATTSAVVGIGQIADALPPVKDAVDNAQHSISSGSVLQIVLGLVAIGIAVYIAYAQVKKHQEGLVE